MKSSFYLSMLWALECYYNTSTSCVDLQLLMELTLKQRIQFSSILNTTEIVFAPKGSSICSKNQSLIPQPFSTLWFDVDSVAEKIYIKWGVFGVKSNCKQCLDLACDNLSEGKYIGENCWHENWIHCSEGSTELEIFFAVDSCIISWVPYHENIFGWFLCQLNCKQLCSPPSLLCHFENVQYLIYHS